MPPLLAVVIAAALGQATFAPEPAGPAPAPPPDAAEPPGDAPAPPAPQGGFWPAPPTSPPDAPAPPTSPGSPAPPAQDLRPPPTGRVVTLLGGVALGAGDQVARRKNGLGAVELGAVFDAGPARAGVVLTLGERGGAGAWSVSALGGQVFRPSAAAEVDLLAELGLLGMWQHGESELLQKTNVSGGAATLPFAGLRLVARPSAEPGGVAAGLFVHQTLGSATAPYRFERCGLFGCTSEDKVARYGGLAVGISISMAWYGRAPPPRAGAASGRAPPPEPPSAEPW